MPKQVGEGALLSALTTRAIETVGERIVKRLEPREAAASRDALAKNLYARLFDWLVAAINRKISTLGAGLNGAGGSRCARPALAFPVLSCQILSRM